MQQLKVKVKERWQRLLQQQLSSAGRLGQVLLCWEQPTQLRLAGARPSPERLHWQGLLLQHQRPAGQLQPGQLHWWGVLHSLPVAAAAAFAVSVSSAGASALLGAFHLWPWTLHCVPAWTETQAAAWVGTQLLGPLEQLQPLLAQQMGAQQAPAAWSQPPQLRLHPHQQHQHWAC